MKYNYGFDLSYEKESSLPFAIETGWALIESSVYENITNTVDSFRKHKPGELFKNGDKIYLTNDVKSMFPPYKLNDYFTRNNLNISIESDVLKADTIIADFESSLTPIIYSGKSSCYLYPVTEILPYLKPESLIKNEVDKNKDFLVVTEEVFTTLKQYFKREKAILKEMSFNYVFDKKETEEQYIRFEPFVALYKAIENNKKLIPYQELAFELHRDSIVIDDDIASNLAKMFLSPDDDNKVLAVNIISDANREKSMPYLISLYYINQSQFQKTEHNVQEFTSFIQEILNQDLTEKNVRKTLSFYGVKDTEMAKYLK